MARKPVREFRAPDKGGRAPAREKDSPLPKVERPGEGLISLLVESQTRWAKWPKSLHSKMEEIEGKFLNDREAQEAWKTLPGKGEQKVPLLIDLSGRCALGYLHNASVDEMFKTKKTIEGALGAFRYSQRLVEKNAPEALPSIQPSLEEISRLLNFASKHPRGMGAPKKWSRRELLADLLRILKEGFPGVQQWKLNEIADYFLEATFPSKALRGDDSDRNDSLRQQAYQHRRATRKPTSLQKSKPRK